MRYYPSFLMNSWAMSVSSASLQKAPGSKTCQKYSVISTQSRYLGNKFCLDSANQRVNVNRRSGINGHSMDMLMLM